MHYLLNLFMPTVVFNICCPRDCVSRHNGGTSGAPLKPLRVDSALRALSTLRGLRGAPVSRTANVERTGRHKWVNTHSENDFVTELPDINLKLVVAFPQEILDVNCFQSYHLHFL